MRTILFSFYDQSRKMASNIETNAPKYSNPFFRDVLAFLSPFFGRNPNTVFGQFIFAADFNAERPHHRYPTNSLKQSPS
jgi:hypothetical protein